MEEISRSDIVISTAGRDQGKLFYVIGTDGVYVLIANGKDRKLEHPKRKKLKHVRIVTRFESRVADKIKNGDKVLNSELRRDLAVFRRDHPCQNQGGSEVSWQKTM